MTRAKTVSKALFTALALLVITLPVFAQTSAQVTTEANTTVELDTELIQPMRDMIPDLGRRLERIRGDVNNHAEAFRRDFEARRPELERSLERNRRELEEQAKVGRDKAKEVMNKSKERLDDRTRELRKKCSESNNTDCLEALDAKLPRPLPSGIRGPAMDAAMHMDMRARLRSDIEAQFPGFSGPERRPRPLAPQAIEKVRVNLENARDNFVKAKDQYHDRLERIKDMGAKAAQCKGKSDVRCDEVRKDIRLESRAALLNAADVTLASLEKAKATINGEEDLSESAATNATAKLDASISAVTNAKANVSLLGENSSSTEIKASLESLKVAIREASQILKAQERVVINARVAGVLVRTAQMESKLDAAIAKAAVDGKNVTAVDAQVDVFHAQLASAKANYDVMLRTNDKAKLEVIKSDLARARESLKVILASLRQIDVAVDTSVAASAEVKA